MASYYLKRGPDINASPYATGMQDGFNDFTSATVDVSPIPQELQAIALLWVTKTGDAWTAHVPYVGTDHEYIYPDDYIITRDDATKYRMSKTEFEAKYELDTGS